MTSVAVVVGGILMYYYHIFWIDPLISVLIAIYLIKASLSLIMESGSILMQFTPKGLDIEIIVKEILKQESIQNVHHIHVWKLDDKRIHLEAHLEFKQDIMLSQSNLVIDSLQKRLHDTLEIEHTTFQCEYNSNHNKEIIA